MHTLLLKLSGPLQSWGSQESRFRYRYTEKLPTKSGVIGLLAAALGRQRGENLEDLVELSFAVRVDQPGSVLRDYQTAINWKATSKVDKNPKLSIRYYLADAVFVAALGGPPEMVANLAQALKRPQYPLFLGRRSCPAGSDILIGVSDLPPLDALHVAPWHASKHHRRTQPSRVSLAISRDAVMGEQGDTINDLPVSFAQEMRSYSLRSVVEDAPVVVHNEGGIDTRDLFFPEVANA